MNADGFVNRYYQRKPLRLSCRTVTPMFLGNADQDAEWRAAPFKALLRYWWRVMQPDHTSANDLFSAESRLFGFAGEGKESRSEKSLVEVRVESRAESCKTKLPVNLKVYHPEVDKPLDKQVESLLYLAGMGLLKSQYDVRHSYFPASSEFQWTIDYTLNIEKEKRLQGVWALIKAFGAIGGRCRNGWGSFQVESGLALSREEAVGVLEACTKPWQDAFKLKRDYPHCLGKDEKERPLLWKTEFKDSWYKIMHVFAEVYVAVRAKPVNGIPPLSPNGRDYADERHLLGFPLTNHPAQKSPGWGGSARHASPLRFIVRKRASGHQGFILHLPHAHSREMKFPNDTVEWQIEVWKKVHQKLDKLDALVQRADYRDCL